MLKNASFALIALFWVAMNALLWHSEVGSGHELASTVPVETVWEKILTAPDASALSIIHAGKRVGSMRWRPNAGEDALDGKVASENEPEGIVRKVTEYKLEIETSFMLSAIGRSIRVTGEIRFDPELRWKRFEAQSILRPTIWRLKGDTESSSLWLEAREGEAEWIRRVTFEELRNPQKLLAELESPILSALLAPSGMLQSSTLTWGLKWTARHEWLRIGSSRVRVYRLTAKISDHEINVLVSRVGEILKAEFPANLKLINETLFAQ